MLNRLFRCRSQTTSKVRVTGLCEGKPPVTGGFPSQRLVRRKGLHLMTSSWDTPVGSSKPDRCLPLTLFCCVQCRVNCTAIYRESVVFRESPRRSGWSYPDYCLSFLTRGQFWPSVVVACVCVCVCLSVCQSLACPRDNSGPVQARITKFGPKMQKTLVKVPIVLWTDRPWPSGSNLTWKSKLIHFELVRTKTHHPFKVVSPNLDQMCKIPWLRSILFWGAIDLDLQGQIWL